MIALYSFLTHPVKNKAQELDLSIEIKFSKGVVQALN